MSRFFRNRPAFLPRVLAYRAACAAKPQIDITRALNKFWSRGASVGWASGLALYLFDTRTQSDTLIVQSDWATPLPTAPVAPTWRQYRGLSGNPDTSAYLDLGYKFGNIPGCTTTNYVAVVYGFADYNTNAEGLGATGGDGLITIRPRSGLNTLIRAHTGASISIRRNSAIGGTIVVGSDEGVYSLVRGVETYTARAPIALPTNNICVFRSSAGSPATSADSFFCVIVGANATLKASQAARLDFAQALDDLAVECRAISRDDLSFTAETVEPPHAFGPNAIASSTLTTGTKFIRFATVPASSDTNLTNENFPGNVFSTSDVIGQIAATGTGDAAIRHFHPRSNQNSALDATAAQPTINTTNGKRGRFELTQYAYARAARMAITAYLGNSPGHATDNEGYLDFLNAAGLPDSAWVNYSDAVTNKDTLFTLAPTNGDPASLVCRDKIIGPNGKATAITGRQVWIDSDFEPNSGIGTPSEVFDHLIAHAALVHKFGFKSMLYCNPLNGGNATAWGVGQMPFWQVIDANDLTGILVFYNSSERNAGQSIRNQLELCKRPDGTVAYHKLFLTVGIGGSGITLTEADAVMCGQAMAGTLPDTPPASGSSKALGGNAFWPNGATFGGAPGGALGVTPRTVQGVRRSVNQVIALCDGLGLGTTYP